MIGKRSHPTFPREYSQFKWRISRQDSWRRPRGKDSKQRRGLESKGAWPTIGYSQPREIRGLHPTGLKEVLVHNPKELDGVDAKTTAVRIAGAVGSLKRADIVKKADGLKIKVLNPFVKKKIKKVEKPKEAPKAEAKKEEAHAPKAEEAKKETHVPKAEEKKAHVPEVKKEAPKAEKPAVKKEEKKPAEHKPAVHKTSASAGTSKK